MDWPLDGKIAHRTLLGRLDVPITNCDLLPVILSGCRLGWVARG